MKFLLARLTVSAALLLAASSAAASALVLNDGTRLEGEVKRSGDTWTVTDARGHVTTVPSDKVKSIEAGSTTTRPDVAAGRLESLRRSVESLSDIQQIIDRYRSFIDQYKDVTDVAVAAAADLDIWRDRKDRGLVKIGAKWVTVEERDLLAAKSLAGAEQARQLMAQGRQHDADVVLGMALVDDPQNAAALYLRGLIIYAQDKFIDARKLFEQVNTLVPAHPPTLNNLAVILYRQHQYGGAMSFYDQALTAMPMNKDILDNAAEALHALPDSEKDIFIVKKLARHFADQDSQLQKGMAQQGWYRWGSTWVNQKQLDELHAAEAEIKTKLDDLSRRYDALQDQITRIDGQVADNQREMTLLESQQYVRDSNGNLVRIPLPQSYYDLDTANQRLASQRAATVAQQNQLRQEAARVQQSLPVASFSGIQHMIGPEGAPLRVPAPPSTNPAAQAVPPNVPPAAADPGNPPLAPPGQTITAPQPPLPAAH